MRENIANFLYSNFLGRTRKKNHPVPSHFRFVFHNSYRVENLVVARMIAIHSVQCTYIHLSSI